MSNPANIQKVSMFFQDNNISIGWSETYHILNASLTLAFAEAQALAGLRANFLPTAMQIPWLRVETLFANRQFIAKSPTIGGVQHGNYAETSLMFPTTRGLLELGGNGIGVTNRVFIGGISVIDVTAQRFTPSVIFNAAFTPYANRLMNPANGWICYSKGNFAGARPVNVTSVTPASPRGNHIEAASTAGLVVGSIVRFAAPPQSIQGIQGYKVVSFVADGFDFTVGGAVAVGEIPTDQSATYTLVTPTYQPISTAAINTLTERRVGRPFGQPHGRQQNRIPLRQ